MPKPDEKKEVFRPEPYFKNEKGEIISRFYNKEKGKFFPNEELKLAPYIPSDDLIELVRMAQVIRRPVLIRGEPGSGKTQLARSVAYEWFGPNYKDHFFEWHIKSTSKASDGIYTFDHIKRLRAVQLDKKYDPAKEDLSPYITLGKFAEAIEKSREGGLPPILLIDEIDKADVDFPNDLLLELDQNRFFIPELKKEIQTENPPIIFITSNDEREMPQAFLRRCLFMWVDFPNPDDLKKIVQAQLPWLHQNHQNFIAEAIHIFQGIREKLKQNPAENKNVSTGELLNWLAGFEWTAKYEQKNEEELIGILMDGKNQLRYYPALLKTSIAYNLRDKFLDKKSAP